MKDMPSFSKVMDILAEGSDGEVERLLEMTKRSSAGELDVMIKQMIGVENLKIASELEEKLAELSKESN